MQRDRNVRVQRVTGDYTSKLDDDIVLANATSASLTVTPIVSHQRSDHELVVIKTDASANTVTVAGVVLAVQLASAVLREDDLGVWYAVSTSNVVPSGAGIAPSQVTGTALTQATGLRVARAKYSFAVDGGAQGTIAPLDSDTIPDNAILLGGQINSTTAVTSGGSATVGIGTSAGSSTTSILAATAKASLSIDALLNAVPTFAAAVKLTAAGTITFTIGAADLTAGVIEAWVIFVVAQA